MKKSKARSKQVQQIRIVAGQMRGRKIRVLDQPGLRPTTDRVRETLFNWLMYKVNGARCLDLFAGTGALGFECLSRGAEFVQFVELSRKSASLIEKTGLELSNQDLVSQCMDVFHGSASDYLNSGMARNFNLAFLDPPFDYEVLEETCHRLEERRVLAERALVYVEFRAGQNFALPSTWSRLKSAHAGEVGYQLYET